MTKRKWFFEDPEHQAALIAEAQSWIGTPFREYSKAKGAAGGTDCVRLCEAIMVNVGLTASFKFPMVPMDFTQHQDRSIMLEFLRGEYPDADSKRLAKLFDCRPIFDERGERIIKRLHYDRRNRAYHEEQMGDVIPGDLLCFKIGKAVNHIGVAVSRWEFIHTFRGPGTYIANVNDPTFDRLEAVFRARA